MFFTTKLNTIKIEKLHQNTKKITNKRMVFDTKRKTENKETGSKFYKHNFPL